MLSVPNSPRNSAVELLRILAMLTIVLSHICCHGGFDYTYSVMTVNRLFVQFGILGNLGVDTFMLIAGYFLCRKSLTCQSVSRLLSQVWFYSIGLFLFCRFVLQVEYSTDALMKVFFPTIFDEYWFFTVYFVMLMMTPALNKMICALTRSQHLTLLLCMTFVWVIIPALTKQQMYGTEFPQFLYMYLIGAYLRIYPDNILCRKRVRWGCLLGSISVLYALTVICGYCERFTPLAFGATHPLYLRNSPFLLTAALGLVGIAINAKPFHNSAINTIGSCTFGVYLIHDNPGLRDTLWKNWIPLNGYFTSDCFIPLIIGAVLLVYVTCTLIEWIRLKTVAWPLAALVEIPLKKLMDIGGPSQGRPASPQQ